jgi:hypothetical protein
MGNLRSFYRSFFNTFSPSPERKTMGHPWEEDAMSKYLVCLIFTAALLGLSPSILHAQNNQEATEPDHSTQSDEKSDEAASPDTSDQIDKGEDSEADQPSDESDQPGDETDQPGDESDQPSDESEPQDR